MKRHFHLLFIPHHHNNHKPRLLHHLSLSKLIVGVLLIQVALSWTKTYKPGVLGFASDITVEQVVTLTNEKREKAGLHRLRFNSNLAQSASEKAADMFSKNYWAHNAPDGTSPWYFFKHVGYQYLYAGENLARDFGETNEVIQAWMESPTHRDNLMSDRYDEIGIAVVNGLLDGEETTLVVQHFGKSSAAVPLISDLSASVESVVETASKAPRIALQEPVEAVVENIPAQSGTALGYQGYQQSLGEKMLLQADAVTTPLISGFTVTKSINLAIVLLMMGVLALDGMIIWLRGTVRRSGKTFVHLSLFALVALIIILTGQGRIL